MVLVDHPTLAELEACVWDPKARGADRRIILHVVECAVCFAVALPHLQAMFCAADPPPRDLSPRENDAYEAAMSGAFAMALEQAPLIREQRKLRVLALLAGCDPDNLPYIPAELRGIPLIEALLELSASFRHESPERMIRFAEWAWLHTDKAPLYELAGEHLADLRCKVLIELGNAYRVADNLSEAKNVLGSATAEFLAGTRDELLQARLMDVQASLFGSLRQFGPAGSALDFVYQVHMQHGNLLQAGRALLKKGIYLGYEGRPQRAVQLLQEGLTLIGKGGDPDLIFLALHNQARLLVDCGRLRDAMKVIFEIRCMRLEPRGRINTLKVRWLEGQIYAALGKFDQAEMGLTVVKEGFLEADLPYKAALVGLELGAVLLRQGKTEECRAEVLPAADIFLALRIHRETLAVVLLLKNKAEREQLDASLLDYVIDLLRRAEEMAGEE